MSATSILGPLLMTNIFAYFTANNAPFYFPEAPFILSAVLTLVSAVLAYRNLKIAK
jgi:DHA1 family tetracycline resistance protein-like MFS transporter